MKKTIKTGEAVTAYKTAQNLKLGKVERNDVFAYIRNKGVLKGVASEYDEFVKNVQEELKPEGWDAIAEKLRANEEAKEVKVELTAEEKEVAEKYNRDLTECIENELKRERELDIEPLSMDGLYALIQANDFVAGVFDPIQDVMCE